MEPVDKLLANLKDDDPKERAQAALLLRDDFTDDVGERLIDALLLENRFQAFVLLCHAVIPKWIVKLERRLSERGDWPFDTMRTLWFTRGVKGWRLPSLESRIKAMLSADDLALRLSAVDYCDDKQFLVPEARTACQELLEVQFNMVPQIELIARAFNLSDAETLRTHVEELEQRFRPYIPDA